MSSEGDHSPSADRAGLAAFEQGNELARKGRYEEAERSYGQAAEEGHPTGAAYAGVFAESHGETERAEQLYRQADEAGDGFGAFRLGMVLSLQGDWKAASEAWERAEERGQEQPPFDPAALLDEEEHPVPAVASSRSAFADPVLLGAVTVLVLLIGVFLAYNSNSGFPFVPTRELKVDIPNGTSLLPGNQVEAGGGADVGIVSSMKPVRLRNGQTVAQLILQLSKSYGPIPADSHVSIDTRSSSGSNTSTSCGAAPRACSLTAPRCPCAMPRCRCSLMTSTRCLMPGRGRRCRRLWLGLVMRWRVGVRR